MIAISPYDDINWETIIEIKAELHSHTTESDGDIPGADLINRHIDAGYGALFITDHDCYRPSKPNRVNNGELYKNTYPWSIFTGVQGNSLITANSVELTKNKHICGYNTTYQGDANYTENTGIVNIANGGGYSILSHMTCGGATKSFVKELFDTYDKELLLGIEINTCSTGIQLSVDRILYDDLLTVLVPKRKILCFAVSDTHTIATLFKGYQIVLCNDNNISDFNLSMVEGKSYACYEYLGSGQAKAPRINSIIHDSIAKTITVNSDNSDNILWISQGNIISFENKINYGNMNIHKYVRIELYNSFGFTCSQPIIMDI